MDMEPAIAAVFLSFVSLGVSATVVGMCAAGIVVLLIGFLAAGREIPEASGLDKIVVLSNLCFAAPLAVFGAEHFGLAKGIMMGVPRYMPWPLFWAYFVGAALILASLSIATKIGLRWSGFLFGIMMFLFVAMIHLPGALANTHNFIRLARSSGNIPPSLRISWTIVFRELSFGSGAWLLAATTMEGPSLGRRAVVTMARVVIGITALLFGVEHFLHSINVPGVPLEKLMPSWIPGGTLIVYFTGALLLVAGVAILLNQKTRIAASYLGSWLLLIVVVIYGPILAAGLLNPSTDAKIEGLNYFFDTLLFAGTILALASALPRSSSPARRTIYSSEQLERPVA